MSRAPGRNPYPMAVTPAGPGQTGIPTHGTPDTPDATGTIRIGLMRHKVELVTCARRNRGRSFWVGVLQLAPWDHRSPLSQDQLTGTSGNSVVGGAGLMQRFLFC